MPFARRVLQTEALAYLASHPAEEGTSVITSLPDVSETPHLDFQEWRGWFVEAVRRVVAWVPDGGVAVFYQSDVRLQGRIVDKGYLVMQGAEAEGASLLWHKIVCRRPPGTIAFGRPRALAGAGGRSSAGRVGHFCLAGRDATPRSARWGLYGACWGSWVPEGGVGDGG